MTHPVHYIMHYIVVWWNDRVLLPLLNVSAKTCVCMCKSRMNSALGSAFLSVLWSFSRSVWSSDEKLWRLPMLTSSWRVVTSLSSAIGRCLLDMITLKEPHVKTPLAHTHWAHRGKIGADRQLEYLSPSLPVFFDIRVISYNCLKQGHFS